MNEKAAFLFELKIFVSNLKNEISKGNILTISNLKKNADITANKIFLVNYTCYRIMKKLKSYDIFIKNLQKKISVVLDREKIIFFEIF